MLKQRLLTVVVPIVAVVAIIIAGYLYKEVRTLKQTPQAQAQKEVADLVAKVSKLIDLPAETPTVATVADPALLKDQAFFEKAEKGDKVLIYAQAKKAILYSVSMNKVLNVAPLNIGPAQTKATGNSTTPAPSNP